MEILFLTAYALIAICIIIAISYLDKTIREVGFKNYLETKNQQKNTKRHILHLQNEMFKEATDIKVRLAWIKKRQLKRK